MSKHNYHRKITVNSSPAAAYKALTEGFAFWWTTHDASFRNVGDIATFTFPPGKTSWAFKATQLLPSKRVQLECVEALHVHEGLPKDVEKEWLGTILVWDIEANGEGADISMVHRGLVPDLHCYEVCEAGWNFFFLNSLQAYLDEGIGNPHAG